MQQILAYETDLLEYDDLFDGNPAVERKVAELIEGARAELRQIDAMGGAVNAIEHMKALLVEASADRIAGIEAGTTLVIGVNRFEAGEPSPLAAGPEAVMVADPAAEADQITRLGAWRSTRDETRAAAALDGLRAAAHQGANIMPPSIEAAKAGITTSEWGDVLRETFGSYRGPTGVAAAPSNGVQALDHIRAEVDEVSARLSRRLSLMVAKPGLDGHSNGAEQIVTRARDCGTAITYDGTRLTPQDIVARVAEENPPVLGLSILSGSHVPLMESLMRLLREHGIHLPVVVGGRHCCTTDVKDSFRESSVVAGEHEQTYAGNL